MSILDLFSKEGLKNWLKSAVWKTLLSGGLSEWLQRLNMMTEDWIKVGALKTLSEL